MFLRQPEPEYAAVYAHITDDIKELVALGCRGSTFSSHAAMKLLSLTNTYSECRYYMLISAMNRQDRKCAEMYLTDWKTQDQKPKTIISKFIPGDHYHVLGVKFPELGEAESYARKKGYQTNGVVEKFVYNKDGD